MGNQESSASDQLIEVVRLHLNFDDIIKAHSRGDEYTLLFLKSSEGHPNTGPLLWINAWLASDNHVTEIENSSQHLQGRYFQQGFHPGYGFDQNGKYYEPIYGGPLEPFVLGRSADDRRIEPELSQEFERCYRLTRTEENSKTIWNSDREGIDEVAILEKHGETCILTARTDFVKDFQQLRNRWLLVGVYGEWGERLTDGPHVWADYHEPQKQKLQLFGIAGGPSYKYVEAQGYFLFPVPDEEGFSGGFGLGVPAGLKATAEKIEFQTSEGRIKPWEVRIAKRHRDHSSATAMFDQEVLRRYQGERRAEVSLGSIGELQVRSKKVHLGRVTMLLGTEYVSMWLRDFVEGVVLSEWPHWQSFNRPFIGFEAQNEFFKAPNLFSMTSYLIRQTKRVNRRWEWFSKGHPIPFNVHHHSEKDFGSLTRALPRHADSHELIDRAKALDGLIVERIAETEIKVFLKMIGFTSDELKQLGSIRLFSTFIMVARITELVGEWHDDIPSALSYAQKKVSRWKRDTAVKPVAGDSKTTGRTDDLAPDESKIIDVILQELEIMFLVHKLRLISAHATTSDLEGEIARLFNEHSAQAMDAEYRNVILWLYDALTNCLEKCGE